MAIVEKPGEEVSAPTEEKEKPASNGEKPQEKEPKTARQKVKKAQKTVLDKLQKIVEGGCTCAEQGNHHCAKFMLDWSGVSELRTPLAAPLKPRPTRKLLGRFSRRSGPAADAETE